MTEKNVECLVEVETTGRMLKTIGMIIAIPFLVIACELKGAYEAFRDMGIFVIKGDQDNGEGKRG